MAEYLAHDDAATLSCCWCDRMSVPDKIRATVEVYMIMQANAQSINIVLAS
jgi:hypothetical protein